MTQDADAPAVAPGPAEEVEAPVAKMLPEWGPYVLGAIFLAQIVIIAVAGITGLRFGAEAAASAERARAYAIYAECLAAREARREAPACIKPAD